MSEKEKQFHKELPTETEKKKEPKISYEILHSAHETATDFKKLAQAFSEADVYVPECVDWTPEISADFNALSQGKKTPEELMNKYDLPENSAWVRELEIIYQSQKPILFPDLGKGHELDALNEKASTFFDWSFKKFKQGNFSEALKTMRDFVQTAAEYWEKREGIIEDNLKIQLNDLVRNKELKNKKEIKVLLSLGASHTSVFHSLKEKEPLTKRQFPDLPFVFLSQDEAVRRARFSKEIKDELLAKIFVENPLCNYFCSITEDSSKALKITRQLSAKISFEEIKNLSENWHKDQLADRGVHALLEGLGLTRELSPVLRKFFQNKGIKIPESEKEIDKMLKSK